MDQLYPTTAPSATQQIARLAAGTERRAAINQIAILWAQQDLPGAVAWVQALPDDEDWKSAALHVANEAISLEPVTALTLALDLPANADRDHVIAQSVAECATTAPVAAREWAKQIPDEPLRLRVLANVATVWGDESPVDAVEFALASLPEGREQDDAIDKIFGISRTAIFATTANMKDPVIALFALVSCRYE